MRNNYNVRRAGLVAGLLLTASGLAQAQTLGIPAGGAQSLAGTYADLGGAGSAIATATQDDANSAPQEIGFSFKLGSSAFTQFVLNTNGFVKLGSTAPSTPYFSSNPIRVDDGILRSGNTFVLAPFNTDLEAAASGSTEYRVATSGPAGSQVCTVQWKNVSDKARASLTSVIDKQLASVSFQLRLYEGSNRVEFVYGPAVASTAPVGAGYASIGAFAQVGLKGAGSGIAQVVSVTKTADTQWSTPTFLAGPYPDYSLGFVFRNQSITGGAAGSTLPDAGRTYRFNPAVPGDLAVRTLYGIAQLPAGQAFGYRAYLTNTGSTAVSGQTATLTLAGANAQTVTVAVPTLAAGASTTVRFPGVLLAQAGTTTVTVALPADGNADNNSQSATTTTSTGASTFSYTTDAAPSGAAAFLASGNATSVFAVKYRASSPYTLNVVRVGISNADDNAGTTVYAVVADTTGRVLAQTTPYQLQASDFNTLRSFVLPTPVQVPAGGFLVGLAQAVQPLRYPAPVLVQAEGPTRPGTFYTFDVSAPTSAPADITAADTPNFRYQIEAGFASTLATSAPQLAGLLGVYPNPAPDGRFTLDLRGAAPAPLTVEVRDALGRRVYAGSAQGGQSTALDLGHLPTGLYLLQVRDGAAVATRKLVVGR